MSEDDETFAVAHTNIRDIQRNQKRLLQYRPTATNCSPTHVKRYLNLSETRTKFKN